MLAEAGVTIPYAIGHDDRDAEAALVASEIADVAEFFSFGTNDLTQAARPGLHLGVCGEHGGDPESIRLCHEMRLDYVSYSPYRVPVARLAAAHAALGTSGPATSA